VNSRDFGAPLSVSMPIIALHTRLFSIACQQCGGLLFLCDWLGLETSGDYDYDDDYYYYLHHYYSYNNFVL
jgi:hypothetical protein